ncbi:uncharacterized protein B0P05DRAFT_540171 [Gilbertella persicaria]|uniref:uncharacterized protein n=1 Tax=Gilbertella persicaria TaxID=101096 RepID=UPI00221E7A0F|nr:uncharacterized protein B0P05DRAFT_540171 [Gilbertella persicaria]KAI8080152.1 hypothetical protein B0P05DRAFT_540171 [Gilbertella persicaria]
MIGRLSRKELVQNCSIMIFSYTMKNDICNLLKKRKNALFVIINTCTLNVCF